MTKFKSSRSTRALALRCAAGFVAAITLTSCNTASTNTGTTTTPSTTATAARSAETGVEKVKPEPGTGNVQGKVLFNSKPAENIEVKLC